MVFGTITVQILHTPGHTEDSMSLVFPDHIFTGDTLFLDDGGAGRDDLPGGNPEAHWESLQRILQLPDDLTVFPAHDYRNRQPSTLGRQKKTNPHLQERTKEEFVRYIEDLRLGPADWMKDVLAANYACARDPKAAWVPVDAPACEVKGTLEKGVNEIEVSAIPPSVLRQKLNAKQPILLLDVREEKELYGELGHIKGIVHIPIGSLAHRLSEIDKDKEIVSICRSGARAHTAAQILKKARFPSVSVLAGGMIAWNKQT
jgi:rhodanese-related sulfurtransferase